MSVSIVRLRMWFAGLAIVAIAVVAGFYFYARIQQRLLLKNLPAKLGIEIQQSSEGFTLNKSEGGRTLFTIHASKVVQYKQGGRAHLQLSLIHISLARKSTTAGAAGATPKLKIESGAAEFAEQEALLRRWANEVDSRAVTLVAGDDCLEAELTSSARQAQGEQYQGAAGERPGEGQSGAERRQVTGSGLHPNLLTSGDDGKQAGANVERVAGNAASGPGTEAAGARALGLKAVSYTHLYGSSPRRVARRTG